MRKKRIICLVISILMMFSAFAVNVSAAVADDNSAEVGCLPIWFEAQELLDEAYRYVEAEDEFTYESRMLLKAVADNVDVLSGSDQTLIELQNAISELVPLTSEDNSTNVEYVTESCFGSEHPYRDDTYKVWVIEDEDAAYIELTFSTNTCLEDGWDFIYIYDENDNLVGNYTDYMLAGEHLFIPGNSVKIELLTDSCYTEYGFDCFWTSGSDFGEEIVETKETVETVETEESEDTTDSEALIHINNTCYGVEVGKIVTYTVELFADRIFEDIQATITYDSDALEILSLSPEFPVLPNLEGEPVINIADENCVKFNHSLLSGMDFREEKVLITLRFVVKKAVESEIDLAMEYMTVLGGEDYYFYRSLPGLTDGIEITENLEVTNIEQLLGDTTGNGAVNVKDATSIQKYLSGLEIFTNIAIRLADADNNGEVNIRDATSIQRFTAGFLTDSGIGNLMNTDTEIESTETETSDTEPAETEPTETETTETEFVELPEWFPVTEYVEDSYFESEHDYSPYTDKTWIVEDEDAEYIELYFSDDTYVENGWDYIYIYDENDDCIGAYTGYDLAGGTVRVYGSVAKIQLVSDYSVEEYGFYCEYVCCNTTYALCGEFTDWNDGVAFTSNGNNTYSITIDIEPGTYEFKIFDIENANWYGNLGVIENECENWAFRRHWENGTFKSEGGRYTFTVFEESDSTLRLSVEECEFNCDSSYSLLGEFTDWNDGVAFTSNGDNTYSVTLDIEPGTYEFKVYDTENEIWYGNAGTIENECENWVFITDWYSGTFNAEGGRYTFTVFEEFDVLRLSVEAEFLPEPEPEMITVYFVKPDNWNDAYIYGIYCEDDFDSVTSWTAEYPGFKMTYIDTNGYGQEVYEAEIPADISYIKFNDGFTAYNYRTEDVPNTEITNQRIYFTGEHISANRWEVDYSDFFSC